MAGGPREKGKIKLLKFFLIFSNTLQWANGRTESIVPGRFPWSSTGIKGQPQPDGGSQETCLAVLNNVYNDGVKFHDVSCPHRKPTICEA
jgi:hypothetical protein